LTELLETHGSTLNPDALMLVEMARTTANGMGNMVDDVLGYTKVVNQELILQKVHLNTVVDDVVADLDAPIRSAQAVIEHGPLPVVCADPAQMRILLQNLIENALKFKARGVAPHVKITASEPQGDGAVAVTVKDNGIGIDPLKHEKIFTIFKRLNAGTDYAGTGLGLAICRRIAANHGGKITLVSHPGAGSAFTIGLPHA
jgi:light-regulated signal transduction histidine kinase (bacteriophytochrome)